MILCCYVTSVVSDSVRPHRRQPTRLPRPWDSPGKNTGVGCHFLLQCMKVKSKVKLLGRVRLFVTPWTSAYQAPSSMGFPGKSTRMGCHFLLQRIFPTQGSNLGLPHCRQMLYHLSHKGMRSMKGFINNGNWNSCLLQVRVSYNLDNRHFGCCFQIYKVKDIDILYVVKKHMWKF